MSLQPASQAGDAIIEPSPALLERELPWRAPADIFASLANEPDLVWLDSAAENDPRSRTSTIAVRPYQRLEARGRQSILDGTHVEGHPFDRLAELIARDARPPGSPPHPFTGGALGLLGYGLAPLLERLPDRHPNPDDLPDLSFGFFDIVLSFDHQSRRLRAYSSGLPLAGEAARERAAARLAEIVTLLDNPIHHPALVNVTLDWRPERDAAAHQTGVRRVLDFIRAGDIFQANLTMRVEAARPPDGPDDAAIYLRLRRESPAPFAAFLRLGGLTLASASPERFLRLDPDGHIETRPIKGTRPRDPEPARDAAQRDDLAASSKDRAENLMIVDLLRHDLGRVAVMGSVRVPQLCAVETFASVHHLVSVVEAKLRPGLGPVDLLRAAFPGGSVTGAPKIRAIEIIDEIETSRRGPYCGAIAAIGFDGSLDSSIVIRTLTLTPTSIIAQAGGGIVADSDPAGEHDELLLKLRPLQRTFEPPC